MPAKPYKIDIAIPPYKIDIAVGGLINRCIGKAIPRSIDPCLILQGGGCEPYLLESQTGYVNC